MNDEELSFAEAIKHPGVYKCVTSPRSDLEEYIVVSRRIYDARVYSNENFTNGICYIAVPSTTPSPSLLSNKGDTFFEPIISVHGTNDRWVKCEHLDIRLCLRTED